MKEKKFNNYRVELSTKDGDIVEAYIVNGYSVKEVKDQINKYIKTNCVKIKKIKITKIK